MNVAWMKDNMMKMKIMIMKKWRIIILIIIIMKDAK